MAFTLSITADRVEVARQLRELADRIDNGAHSGNLRDQEDQLVGRFGFDYRIES